ncbi:hypothetical protein C8R46DRAFT_29528 [Mycena filopes]|nr:hypothetical protein C8R46DRAFT_29528 [Mycena filopes]
MPFFENATNFKISGGTFNVIAGDLNQYENHHSTYTSTSYNEYPEDVPAHRHYDPYQQWPPRGRYPSHRRPQHRYQEQGPFGYAEYYDDRQSHSETYYDGGYSRAPGRFENSLRSATAPVEIEGGEFNEVRGRDATQRYQGAPRSSFRPQSEDSVPSPSVDDPIHSGNSTMAENAELDSDTSMSDDEESPETAVSGPAPIPVDSPPPAPRKPLTTVEKMRMAMAGMEIDATDGPPPQAPPAPPPEARRRPKSSNKRFSFGQKRT